MKATRILVPMQPEMLVEIDQFQQREGLSSRVEAIRVMIHRTAQGVIKPPLLGMAYDHLAPYQQPPALVPQSITRGEPCAAQPPKPLKKLPLPPRRL